MVCANSDAKQARSSRVDGNRLQESTSFMKWTARPEKGVVRFVLALERPK